MGTAFVVCFEEARLMERRSFARWLSLVVLLIWLAPLPMPARGEETDKQAEKKQSEQADKKQIEEDYELYQIFAYTLDQVERNYVKDVSRRELMEAAIHGVLSKLDPYSNYISPEDISRFKVSVESQFGGIGIQVGMEDGQLKVISPLIGTPAYRAGLEAGDAILEINGQSTDAIRNVDEAVKLLKGEAGTKVALTIQHAGSSDKQTFSITREWVHVETVLGDRRKSDDTWDFMLDHDKHLGYIRISAFSRDTAQDLKQALTDLKQQGIKGLILDLRFNPGGLLNSAIEVSDLFIANGRIVSTKGRNTPERVWDAQQEGTFEGFPMAVLVNHFSASASEILSACLQDHKRAVVIGERTWGKGSVQNVIELEGGKSALKLTTASYHRPSGKNIHRFPDAKDSDEWGVLPDPGYDIKLSNRQLERMIHDRHDRDILLGKHSKSKVADKDKQPPVDEAASAEPPAAAADSKPEPPPADAQAKDTIKDAAKDAAKTPFVDPQLQRALDYLTQELARAQ
jgi:carboxyl-terminal processing protease